MRTMAKRKKPDHISQQDWDAVDSPALTEKIVLDLRPASETFPELAKQAARKRGQRGPQKRPRKVTVSLRIDREVIAAYKAGGKGYQSRMAAVLEKNAR
jgi:uncharacterized protein (DUF4415 family)